MVRREVLSRECLWLSTQSRVCGPTFRRVLAAQSSFAFAGQCDVACLWPLCFAVQLHVLDLVVVIDKCLRSGFFVCPREEVPDVVHKSAHK